MRGCGKPGDPRQESLIIFFFKHGLERACRCRVAWGLAPHTRGFLRDARTPEWSWPLPFSPRAAWPPLPHNTHFFGGGALAAIGPSSRHLERPGKSLRKGRLESKSSPSPGGRKRPWALCFWRGLLSSSAISLAPNTELM